MFTPYTPNFQSLMLMLDAAHMGWWKANFQTGELYVSEYIARLLGLDGDKIRIGQLTHLIREDYRMPIHNEFMFSLFSWWNTIISSIRLINSGLKLRFTSSMTLDFIFS